MTSINSIGPNLCTKMSTTTAEDDEQTNLSMSSGTIKDVISFQMCSGFVSVRLG